MGLLIEGVFKMRKTNVTNVDTVANFFLSKESMTPKKLQKICYYAYAWYLTLYDKYLLDDEFEAWVHGPVNVEIYHKYRMYGWNNIPKNQNVDLDEDLTEFLEMIYNTFKDYDGDQLESMTHNETPWREARIGLQPEEPSNNIINDNTIKSFYSGLMEKNQVE